MERYKRQTYNSGLDIKKIIIRDILYQHTHFINAEMLDLLDQGLAETDEAKIYVFA